MLVIAITQFDELSRIATLPPQTSIAAIRLQRQANSGAPRRSQRFAAPRRSTPKKTLTRSLSRGAL